MSEESEAQTQRIPADAIARARNLGPGEPEAERPPRRRRGVVWLDARAAEAMLRLPEGQRVVSLNVDWLRDGIAFIVEGPGLPEQAEMSEPVRVPAGDYIDFHLLDKVRALAERWNRDGQAEQTYGELHALLIATLTGNFDPRTELPS